MSQTLIIAIIGGRRCAFHAEDVKSVIETGAIIPIPRAPDYILGLTALRSQALTVIDCRVSIGCADESHPTDERAAVISHGGHQYALVVDRIEDIDQSQSDPMPVPGGFGSRWSRMSSGLVETASGPALLLNMSDLVTRPHVDTVAA